MWHPRTPRRSTGATAPPWTPTRRLAAPAGEKYVERGKTERRVDPDGEYTTTTFTAVWTFFNSLPVLATITFTSKKIPYPLKVTVIKVTSTLVAPDTASRADTKLREQK